MTWRWCRFHPGNSCRLRAVQIGDMSDSVVDFDQTLDTGDEQRRLSVVATIIWKRVDDAWKESGYHSSLVRLDNT